MSRRELDIPAPPEAQKGIEMARIWIDPVEGESHIALHYGCFGEDELRLWGSLVADLIAHVVRAERLEGSEHSADQLFAAVEAGLRDRLAHNPTLTGKFKARALQ